MQEPADSGYDNSGVAGRSKATSRGPTTGSRSARILCKDDERGITSFGESRKAAGGAAIGKFGLGQKAVLHLCDAFVVYAYGDDEPFASGQPVLGSGRRWQHQPAMGAAER